jgi:hypothetical protein
MTSESLSSLEVHISGGCGGSFTRRGSGARDRLLPLALSSGWAQAGVAEPVLCNP